MKIYTNISEIEQDPDLLGYVRALQRAWNPDGGLGITQVGCLGNTPTIFVKECKQTVSAEQLRGWHRLFWNQGIASVLLIIDPRTAYVFSGMEPPAQTEKELCPMIERWDVVQDFFQNKQLLFHKVESGDFYRQYKDKFQPTKSVDGYLTANLLQLRNYLSPNIGEDCSHDFICRLLFVCYLVDRGIYSLPDYTGLSLHAALLQMTDEEALKYLYKQFHILKTKFNGSMFDQNLQEESSKFQVKDIARLKAFLHGDELATGQTTLGFWAYDFKWIPVETISCIYEHFLTGIDRKKKGAYYTPRLLAEMTIDCAVDGDPNWYQKRYLDPSCGSGIFLVTLFNRLATYWQLTNKHHHNEESFYMEKDAALRHILEQQIVGIDIKQASCVLTCFSLYIAFLDFFEPIDILTYQERSTYKKLPKLLRRKKSAEQDDSTIPVVMEDNALQTQVLTLGSFDIVLGNPPWVSRGSKQLALPFIDRARDFLKDGGTLCQILPSKVFLNIRTEEWQLQFFQQWILDRVVQMADYSHILFSSAQAPSMILKASKGIVENNNHSVIYDTPKFNASCRPQGMVLISALDRKMIRQSELIFQAREKKAHVFWKGLFWGTGRDGRLLRYLEQLPKLDDLAGVTKSRKRWIKGQGFQPAAPTLQGKRKEAWWHSDDLYISAQQDILFNTAYLLKADCNPIGDQFPFLGRDRKSNKDIFTPPMVLISQGFEKVVFCDFPVLFQDSLQSIHAPLEDEDILLFLTAYLQSDLARYYCFHTSSTWGIERDVVRLEEVLQLPFPLPEEAPATNGQQIIKTVADYFRSQMAAIGQSDFDLGDEDINQERKNMKMRLKAFAAPFIDQYFGIIGAERILIEDTTHIFFPSATPRHVNEDIPTLYPLEEASRIPSYENGLVSYADVLTATINGWAEEEHSPWRVRAQGYVDHQKNMACLSLHLSETPGEYQTFSAKDIESSWKSRLACMDDKQAATHMQRQIFVLENNAFHVVRPDTLTYWTKTAALNDADEIYRMVLQMK